MPIKHPKGVKKGTEHSLRYMDKIGVHTATQAKESLLLELSKFVSEKKPMFADFRFEASEGTYAEAINGNSKSAGKDYGIALGVRVFAGKEMVAGGFAGTSLGPSHVGKEKDALKKLLEEAEKKARINSEEKYARKEGARGIYSTKLAAMPQIKAEKTKKFTKTPLDANIEDFVKRSEGISKETAKIAGVATNAITIVSALTRKIYGNSEGSLIEQTRAITEPSIYIAAKGKAQETYHEWLCDAKGLEVLEGDNPHKKTLEDFAEFIAKGTVELSNAPAMKPQKNVAVVTDPWFNTLVSHEVCGHPLEADRALKRETAWAGRAWWFNNLEDNLRGKSIGSEEMTVASDPGMGGYGNYDFDDEGVAGKRVLNIKKGVLCEFMNSRETSLILGEAPNGHMRAHSASAMPLIRMSTTYFEKGSWKHEELIEDTKDGYYIVGEKTPSIGESRQNFNITCWKAYKIENGEIGQLYRQAGVEANSNEYFKTLEAADDVKIYNVPNCGKGTPMQTMRLSNGGPHMRGIANVTGKR
ncbi:MAG: TldD/PmbA family protein [archaeon]|nr:TldD/PmbA family protein [archaeon]